MLHIFLCTVVDLLYIVNYESDFILELLEFFENSAHAKIYANLVLSCKRIR